MRKILVSAYGCEPGKGSEQGVGWNWVLEMARNNKLFVVTRSNNRESIEANLPKEVADNIEFYYYDTAKVIKGLKKRARGLYFYYFCWQLGIIPTLRRIIKHHRPDYSMHLTFGSMWMPTFLPWFRTPFIWGPIGGGDCEPRSFFSKLPFKQRVGAYLRVIMNKSVVFNLPLWFNCSRAVAILCRTKSSGDVLLSRFNKKKHVILESAIEMLPQKQESDLSSNSAIRLVTTGRLTASKNIVTAVRALADLRLKGVDLEYRIIGSGSEKARIEAEVAKFELQNRVKIIDEMTRDMVVEELRKSDIFLFPSLREGGSWALMEAMAVGLPVVCLDWSGMKIITDDQSAIRLPVTNPAQVVKDMADAIFKLVNDSELRCRMGEAGRQRIEQEFSWGAKGRFMESLLEELNRVKQKQK